MKEDSLAFLVGGGEMGERIRAFDWARTPLGPATSWSPAQRMMLRILLANRFPQLLWWGPQYIQFYNDPYRPIPGKKHPDRVLGVPASECWKEIWHVIGPLIDTPFSGGPPTWNEDIFLEINRHGFLEESHFTIAYSPVPDETAPNGIGGVLATVHEITEKVVGERRGLALRDLGGRLVEAKTVDEACRFAAETLARHDRDVPFSLFYLLEDEGKSARLIGSSGLGDPTITVSFAPREVDLDAAADGGWPLRLAKVSGAIQLVDDLRARFPGVPQGPWSDAPHSAVVVPIPSRKPSEPAALMVAGLSSRLQWNDFYRDFFDLVRTQVATSIANARAYEEEKRRAEALAELDRAKTAFFSNVSHEFRTPLTLMLGPIEDLLDRGGGEAHGELEVVHRNGQRLLRLVNTLLDFSRIEAGRVRARYQPTDLGPFTADLASIFRAAVERAGLALLVECPSPAAATFVDREMWEKIVLNLLSNALKFTFEGDITVTLREREDAHVELEVRDTGTGIPASEMPRLFERFHRVQNARGRTHEGSGIGLALVQELVRLHGGTLSAVSEPGKGTTFTVVVPPGSAHLPPEQVLDANSPAAEEPPLPAGRRTNAYVEEALRWISPLDVYDDAGGPEAVVTGEATGDGAARARVLVADDNADMRQYLARLLAGRYRTEVVADGEAACAVVSRSAPDLILTDVMMPKLDGFGLLKRLRASAETRDIPVIMLSARAGEESRVVGMEAGADDYLVKPFSARELLARVSGHLDMARMRREAGEALQESHDRFKAVLDAAPLGVFLVGETLRILQVNPKARPVFGDIERVLGRDLIGADFAEVMRVLWPRELADEMVGRFRHTLTTGETYFEAERTAERLDRKVREYYEWRIHRIALPEGSHGVVCYFSDISRHVLARLALSEADRRKNEFLAVLAHELRNPLAPLRSALHVLKLAKHDPAAREDARLMMERQLTLMVRLIDDLMDMSRINRGKVELRREPIALGEAVRLAVETSRPEIERRGHSFTVVLPDDPIGVVADVDRLAQVFSNLLNNAAKYTEPGGEVALVVDRRGEEAIVRVCDTGVGIPPEMLPRVFDIFTQVDRTLEGAQGGLGIGLSLVKGLVETHGGTVEAHSAGRGLGSEFVVRLPALPEMPAARGNGAPSAAPVMPRRVLIVDDNRDAAVSLAAMLNFMGNVTQTAHDGVEALDVAETFRPDLVVLDIGMPRLSGYDTARRLRERPWGRDVVLVALTGWGQEEDRRRSRDAGFDSHLVKPIEPLAMEQLLAHLRPPVRA
ncbi:MAG TPA: ATP-binding protein, partial [Candidatus Polarisedimenticolia bacterium]|nr:ATP-binding protein [Candidatus Polarisedimenticolia bacterium]